MARLRTQSIETGKHFAAAFVSRGPCFVKCGLKLATHSGFLSTTQVPDPRLLSPTAQHFCYRWDQGRASQDRVVWPRRNGRSVRGRGLGVVENHDD